MFRYYRVLSSASFVLIVGLAITSGCTESSIDVGARELSDATPPSFAAPDAQVAETEAGLTSYCPSNRCPTAYTTCPNSRFQCDVNLLADRNNCGACGVVCPNTERETFECIEGHCETVCKEQTTLDCDGIPDNGCESEQSSNDNCGRCDVQCTDTANPCAWDRRIEKYQCGCDDPYLACDDGGFGFENIVCVDSRSNDYHCGRCGNSCDPNNYGEPPDPSLNIYYGCVHGECGHAKCYEDFAECDGDFSNGCETDTRTAQNCGKCGNVCPEGKECHYSDITGFRECMCAPGSTFCPTSKGCTGSGCSGHCVDLDSDLEHCGGCNLKCNLGTCVNGYCKPRCPVGLADCNDNGADGCETNINSDPRNCGACGVVCDPVAGQVCAGGSCAVEPCPSDDPGRPPL